MDKKSKALKGLKCCAEFLCGECPYAEHQHIEYKLRCSHIMHQDLTEVLEPKEIIRVSCYDNGFPDEMKCPSCGKFLGFITNEWKRHCPDCGQHLLYTSGGKNYDIIANDILTHS